ncbi:MAG TPA: phytanoyl-CoA dioxygenase family protein [Caldilineaceae bacterium]|nr:phytanoyl-CoA dioxygenase family protein [Caldilineaceae bacterium]
MATLGTPSATNGSLTLTAEQRQQFEEDGFFLVEDALSPAEIDALVSVIDELYAEQQQLRNLGPHDPFQWRNVVALHPIFRDLIDHPKLLPLVVDLIGYNIQIRTSHLDVRPPMRAADTEKALGARDSFFPWHSDAPNYGWPTVDGVIPYMEMKVGLYLTDLTQHNSGAICVVRGSHRRAQRDEQGELLIDPADIVEVNVRPGTALVWRTALLHCVTPNLSDHARKCLYYGYNYRWIRPSDYDHQEPAVLAGCNPVQRQLLGELGDGSVGYNGPDPLIHPVSRYWRPQDADIPVKAWAMARENG